MIYTYAFLKTPVTTLNLPQGIAGEIKLVEGGNLSALVEFGVSWETIQADETLLMQAVLAHDQVLCEVYWQTVLLPLRFGTFFATTEALVAHLEAQKTQYLRQLESFAGKAEYTVKLIPKPLPAGEISTTLTGKQYFLAKKQRFQTQQTFQTEQAEQAQQLYRLIVQAYPNSIAGSAQSHAERFYLLVDLNEATQLAQQFQEWQQVAAHWELQLSEPLPPYHFVGEIADQPER